MAVTLTVPRDSSVWRAPGSATVTRDTLAPSVVPVPVGTMGSPGVGRVSVIAPGPSLNTALEASVCAMRLASVPARFVLHFTVLFIVKDVNAFIQLGSLQVSKG